MSHSDVALRPAINIVETAIKRIIELKYGRSEGNCKIELVKRHLLLLE
jgi:hypothetical protein